jgi:hypothetical protein
MELNLNRNLTLHYFMFLYLLWNYILCAIHDKLVGQRGSLVDGGRETPWHHIGMGRVKEFLLAYLVYFITYQGCTLAASMIFGASVWS